MRNRDNLRKSDFKEKFYSIYESVKYKKGEAWILAEPSISSSRMLLTCAALLFVQRYRGIQFVLVLFLHYFVMIYNG
jgi:hypothetical protein